MMAFLPYRHFQILGQLSVKALSLWVILYIKQSLKLLACGVSYALPAKLLLKKTDETLDYDIILKCDIKFYYLEFNYDIVCSNYCMTAFRQHRVFLPFTKQLLEPVA